jgi:hypothetical protein
MTAGRSTALRVSVLAAVVLAGSFASREARADDKASCMASAAKGQELRDEGKLTEAKPFFQQCAEASCPAPIPGYCAEWLADLNKKMPTVVFRVTDENGKDVADANVEIDGKRTVGVDGRAIDVDPGKHTIKVARTGSKPFEDVIIVAQGEKDRVVIAKLASAALAPAVAASTKKTEEPATGGGVPTASVVAWAVGGVALLSFGGFALKAKSDYDDYESRCGNRCAESERDTVATSVLIADVSLVVAIVAAGVGTYFYLTRPAPSAPPKEAAAR